MRKASFIKISCLGALLLFCGSVYAQNTEDKQREEFEQRRKLFREKQEENRKRFKAIEEENANKFAQKLAEHWKQFNLLRQKSGFKKKYEKPPVFQPEEKPKKDVEIKNPIIKEEPKKEVVEPPIEEPEKKPTPPKEETVKGEKQTKVSFLGESYLLTYETSPPDLPQNIDNEIIAKYWQATDTPQNQNMAVELKKQATEANLNDWAYVRLLKTFSKEFYTDRNQQNIWVWSMLVQSGLKARIGYNNSQDVFVLLDFVQDTYSSNISKWVYSFDNEKYVAVSLDDIDPDKAKKLNMYYGDLPTNLRKIDLSINKIPAIDNKRSITKDLLIKENAEDVKLSYNKEMADLYKSYPYCNLSVYMDAPVSDALLSSLKENLKPMIAQKNYVEAVGFILSFVQKSFGYKTDQEQFGYENPLFAEEFLGYSYVDCEDRTVFFAKLVKVLLNLDVIALKYPNHLAAAVHFPQDEKIEGTFIHFKDEKYYVCDPTYIGAGVGACMPDLIALQPEIIL